MQLWKYGQTNNCFLSFFQTWYNLTVIDDVLRDFLQVPVDQVIDNELYKHDLVDITRQMLQNKIDLLYKRIISAFLRKKESQVQTLAHRFESILVDLDRILHSNEKFLLGSWLQASKSIATNRLEEQVYEFNARNQITIWGPNGQIVDYAMKQWAGVVADYCLPRWQLFFAELLASFKGRTYNDGECGQKIFKQIEEPFGVSIKEYGTKASGDSIAIAKEIYKKYSGPGFITSRYNFK